MNYSMITKTLVRAITHSPEVRSAASKVTEKTKESIENLNEKHKEKVAPKRYNLGNGKSADNLANTIKDYLINDKKMNTQIFDLKDGNIILQARAKGGNIKQFVGMDKAITVKIKKIDSNTITVDIGESKWIDKGVIMTISMFVLWPLAITSGVGMYQQGKLKGNIEDTISRYLTS